MVPPLFVALTGTYTATPTGMLLKTILTLVPKVALFEELPTVTP
jgi:hypothetical protein